ncbi:MAG: NAD(P)/FAD-dependent oxidoreductase [Gammaproteobacteria bacterium]|nr:NAD(P)/FAD-dependent oxidoreductase [Gammaproteobacteria bacterium]MDH4253276.1 NAD(P)/FAD-dependent oxidoreductase [Gammaproteobacteria bacterium]MDH5310249.1 NAD(P)/FAD-dependent oxidoreductase [Gammaproteobacteria bacterium]
MSSEYFDVIIVGAGLSGIGAACHLQRRCPGRTYAILEGRAAMGGTWDLFRYPGIRSDSDMHTLGYSFKPWRESKAIADGPSILEYIRQTAREYDVERHIRYGHLVIRADWSGADSCWTLEARCDDTGSRVPLRCNVLLMCAGYYSYEHGHTPAFAGADRFKGTIVHPQRWPADLDYRGKRVVVVGSGATAMTLIPAMAQDVSHIVMLQRSPTYVIAMPDRDVIANTLRRLLPEKWAYAITRWKNIGMQRWIYRRARSNPEKVRRRLTGWVRKALGPDYDVEKHFMPRYNPWEQRLCLIPNGDLYDAINSGKASVVTDHIRNFTEKGILLESGRELEADIIVTATGLDLVVLGGAALTVDGLPVDFANTFTYKGVMFSDVPNLVSTFGYVNASWTLRADLIAEFSCRLLNFMDEHGYRICTPRLRAADRGMQARPWVEGFSPGYLQRVAVELPKQGDREPWLNLQDYKLDRKRFLEEPLEDGALVFEARQTGERRELRATAT